MTMLKIFQNVSRNSHIKSVNQNKKPAFIFGSMNSLGNMRTYIKSLVCGVRGEPFLICQCQSIVSPHNRHSFVQRSKGRTFVPFRSMSQGRLPIPKIPPTKIMQHYDIHGTISDEDSAKQFIYALSANERKRLLKELENFRDLEEKIDHAAKPSRQQLKQVALHQTFPFIGFGFLDNLLMICFGEYIDVTLGTALGISTMAAAALGNLLSDVGGIGSASYVENIVSRLGIRAPRLSPEQVEMKSTRWASSLGKSIGVTIGCLLGMFPLLFFSDENKGKDQESVEDNK